MCFQCLIVKHVKARDGRPSTRDRGVSHFRRDSVVDGERRIENEELSSRCEGLLLAFFLFLSLKENRGEGVGDNWVWPFVSSILSFLILISAFER